MPTVSVIIPSYNHEKYIGGCIQSVLDQVYQDLEIVITDDASRDNTVRIIRQFNDPRIKLSIQKINKGTSAATNNSIQRSTGTFLAFLGSDDVWQPGKLEKQVRFLEENPHVGAVFTREIAIDQNDQRVPNSPYSKVFDLALQFQSREDWLRSFFFYGNCLCAPSALIRRNMIEQVGSFDERLSGLQDFDLWVKICMRHDLHVLDERLTLYRTHDDLSNLSADTVEHTARNNFEYKQILKNFLQIRDVEFFKRVFPESVKYGKVTAELIPFFLGRIAVDTDRPFQQQWGIELIHDFLGNGESVQALEKANLFSQCEYIDLTGKALGEEVALRKELVEARSKYAQMEQAVRALTGNKGENNSGTLVNSIFILWKVRMFLFPQGSRRERLLRKVVGLLRHRKKGMN